MALSTDGLNRDLEAFFDRACARFDPDMQLYESRAEEHALEYMDLWTDYQSILEGAIDAFCDDRGADASKIAAAAAAATGGGDPVADAMLDVFVSTSSYPCFAGMMVERARQRRARADAKGGDDADAADAKGGPHPAEAKGAK